MINSSPGSYLRVPPQVLFPGSHLRVPPQDPNLGSYLRVPPWGPILGSHMRVLVLGFYLRVLGPIFLVRHLKACNFIKKRLQHRCFPVILQTFQERLFQKPSANGCFYDLKLVIRVFHDFIFFVHFTLFHSKENSDNKSSFSKVHLCFIYICVITCHRLKKKKKFKLQPLHNILRLFDVLPNFLFTTSEAVRDYYL